MNMNTLIILQILLFSLNSCEKKENKNDFPIDFCCPPFCEIENNTPLSEGSYETKIDSKISVQNETKEINMEKTINFDDNDAIDWFSTVVSFSLFENVTENYNKWGTLKVPEGEEQFWVDELKKYEIVQYASLNHINLVLRN